MEDNEKKVFDRVIRLKNRPLSASKSFIKSICVWSLLICWDPFILQNFNKIRGILKGDLGLPNLFPYFKQQLGIIKGSFFIRQLGQRRETELRKGKFNHDARNRIFKTCGRLQMKHRFQYQATLFIWQDISSDCEKTVLHTENGRVCKCSISWSNNKWTIRQRRKPLFISLLVLLMLTPLPQIVNKASLIKKRAFSSRILLVTENANSLQMNRPPY